MNEYFKEKQAPKPCFTEGPLMATQPQRFLQVFAACVVHRRQVKLYDISAHSSSPRYVARVLTTASSTCTNMLRPSSDVTLWIKPESGLRGWLMQKWKSFRG